MKFSEMPYSRPDGDEIKNNIKALPEGWDELPAVLKL